LIAIFLRHEILPLLKTRWPSVFSSLSRVSEHCAQTADLLADVAQEDLEHARQEAPNILSIDALESLSQARLINALRCWIQEQQHTLPSTVKMKHILKDVIHAKKDAIPSISWGDVILRRYQHHLYLDKMSEAHDPSTVLSWDLSKELLLPGNMGRLCVTEKIGHGIRQDIDVNETTIRFRTGGERIRLAGHKEHQVLKKLFQTWKIPPWKRDRIPLIYCRNDLVAIVSFGVAADFQAKKTEKGIDVSLIDDCP